MKRIQDPTGVPCHVTEETRVAQDEYEFASDIECAGNIPEDKIRAVEYSYSEGGCHLIVASN
jgi:hypothetical protein